MERVKWVYRWYIKIFCFAKGVTSRLLVAAWSNLLMPERVHCRIVHGPEITNYAFPIETMSPHIYFFGFVQMRAMINYQ